jgi:hypothetical protein
VADVVAAVVDAAALLRLLLRPRVMPRRLLRPRRRQLRNVDAEAASHHADVEALLRDPTARRWPSTRRPSSRRSDSKRRRRAAEGGGREILERRGGMEGRRQRRITRAVDDALARWKCRRTQSLGDGLVRHNGLFQRCSNSKNIYSEFVFGHPICTRSIKNSKLACALKSLRLIEFEQHGQRLEH